MLALDRSKHVKNTHKLVKTPERATDRLPHGEEQANGTERLLSSRQRLRVLVLLLLLARLLRLHAHVKGVLLVIEGEFAGEASVREVEEELQLGSGSDGVAEVGPSDDTSLVGGVE